MLILANILNSLKYGLTGLFLIFDGIVFWAVSTVFSLYEALARGPQIIGPAQYQDVATKFYVVVGVVTLFYITYSLLKALINPDDLNKSVGKIAVNLVISLILLGVVPLIFNYAFEIQDAIIEENVIGNLVLGKTTDDSSDDRSLSKRGANIAIKILTAFIELPGDATSDEIDGETITWNDFIASAKSDARVFFNLTAFAEPIHESEAFYVPIVSTICGAFLVYVVLSFCIDLGIRVAKLAFYQIIAPIPILLRIIPEKKSVFDNWVKGSIATFMEVFIRLFIVFLIVYLANFIFETELFSGNVGFIGNIIIVLGFFAFAKQAPKLLGDMMGLDAGNIKLGIGGKLKSSGVAGGAILGAAGAITGGLGGAWTGLMNGSGIGKSFLYGAYKGTKSKGNQFNKQRKSVYNNVLGQKGDAGWFGGEGIFSRMEVQNKKDIQETYEKSSQKYVERVNNSKKYRELYADIKEDYESQYQKLLEQYRKESERFEREKAEKIKDYQEQYALEETKFKQDNFNKIMSLQNAIDAAERAKDTARVNTLTSQLQDLQNAKFEDSEMAITLTNQMNRLENSHYENRNLEAEMSKIPHSEEAYALATEKALAKEDRRYKANREYVQTRAAEKAAKEWREANPTEAAINQEMLNKMFDNYTKEHGGGAPVAAKNPSAGSGGTPSSGSSGKK